ncbi:hypothetical protein SRHO_G00006250 [Serrasalmus rhombeus]
MNRYSQFHEAYRATVQRPQQQRTRRERTYPVNSQSTSALAGGAALTVNPHSMQPHSPNLRGKAIHEGFRSTNSVVVIQRLGAWFHTDVAMEVTGTPEFNYLEGAEAAVLTLSHTNRPHSPKTGQTSVH